MIDEVKALRVDVASLTRERDQLLEALAAARRECEGLRKALDILERHDIKAAIAALNAAGIPLPHVAWSGSDEERSGAAYEWAGSFEDDARYIAPARDNLWSAVARAALAAPGAGEEGK